MNGQRHDFFPLKIHHFPIGNFGQLSLMAKLLAWDRDEKFIQGREE
ncbi:hypothetical protein SAMN05444412_11870 [Rhodonellum ikkaensis]|uniref:Uncharacterized protein n=1 Tax=Rhodonellum ikkaensis TaxID=336829 RepID=A0A1H3TLR4_9BACT|nr:hypothetical protein SAMN05444412_11870 [Rhodonellum ikkaensis]